MFKKIIITLVLAIVPMIVLSETPIQGDFQGTTWNHAGSPYLIQASVHLTSGTLNIVPDGGVEIIFYEDCSLTIDGGATFNAPGTEADPIIFTSSSGNPAAGDWQSIIFVGDNQVGLANGSFRWCEFTYGGDDTYFATSENGASGVIELFAHSSVSVRVSKFTYCLGAAIAVRNQGSNSLTSADSLFIEGLDVGIKCLSSASAQSICWNKINSCDYGVVLNNIA